LPVMQAQTVLQIKKAGQMTLPGTPQTFLEVVEPPHTTRSRADDLIS